MRRTSSVLILGLVAACGGGGGAEIPDARQVDAEAVDAAPAPDSNVGTARIDATWTLFNDGAPATCPSGATTAAITATRAGDPTPYVDVYACNANAGSSADLPAGDYTVRIDLTDTTGATLYAQSESVSITLNDGDVVAAPFDLDAYNGYWDVSWTLHNANGTATTCAAVTQNGVDILSTNSSTNDATDSIYNCVDGEAPTVLTVDPVPVGPYVVSLSLLDNTDTAIGSAPNIVTAIDFGNQHVALGTRVITLF